MDFRFISEVGHVFSINQVLFKVVEQHAKDLSEGLDSTKLVYGDESIPSLFEASIVSQKQLPGKQGAVLFWLAVCSYIAKYLNG